MKRIIATTSVIGLALALSACADTGATESSGGEELDEVTIATQPIVDSAPLYLGLDKGFFEEEGLSLKIETAAGGAAVIPGVIAGTFEFGRGNLLSTMVAMDKGLDLQCITNANSTAGNPDFGAVVVQEDSPIKTMADLPGNTVSVNTLSNIGDTTIRSIVEEAGGDPDGIDFVEVGFPEAPAALANGQVDAAWILDPFLADAVNHGGRVLSYNFSDFHPDLDISCVFATGEMVENDPELVARFQRAMNKSLEYSQNNPDDVRQIVSTYTEIDPSALSEMVLPVFRTEFNRESVEKLGAKAVEYGTLTQAPDLNTLLPKD